MPKSEQKTEIVSRLSVEVRGPDQETMRNKALEHAAMYFGVPEGDSRLLITSQYARVVYYDVTGMVPQLYAALIQVGFSEPKPAEGRVLKFPAGGRSSRSADGVVRGRFAPGQDALDGDDDLDDEAEDDDE